jgi:hypothetical protein
VGGFNPMKKSLLFFSLLCCLLAGGANAQTKQDRNNITPTISANELNKLKISLDSKFLNSEQKEKYYFTAFVC